MRVPADFYPRSPCGERPCKRCHCPQQRAISIHALLAESDLRVVRSGNAKSISIHALLAESDPLLWPAILRPRLFLSTLSLRRATSIVFRSISMGRYFYPRSPCGERLSNQHISSDFWDFYPRSPCGERLLVWCSSGGAFAFLSTLSLRRATSLLCFMIHLV